MTLTTTAEYEICSLIAIFCDDVILVAVEGDNTLFAISMTLTFLNIFYSVYQLYKNTIANGFGFFRYILVRARMNDCTVINTIPRQGKVEKDEIRYLNYSRFDMTDNDVKFFSHQDL